MNEQTRRGYMTEWAGDELEYVEPTQVVRSFGYDVFSSPFSDEAMAHVEATLGSLPPVLAPPATSKTGFDSAAEAAAAIKEIARAAGAADVGITRVDPAHVYKGMDVPHQYVIVVAAPMEYDEMRLAATERHIREVVRSYAEVGKIAAGLTTRILELGYDARPHSLRFEQINLIPHAIAAGLGELGKHGSLINRDLGSSFRLAAVTTELELATDGAADHAVEDLCKNCNRCVTFCPGDAIQHDKQEMRGTERWIVDTEKCAPYWGSHYSCGVCLAVCPFNARGFDGRYKQSFIRTIKAREPQALKAALDATLQQAWSLVTPPADRPQGWRNNVRGSGESAILMQGIPQEGLPDWVYEARNLMGIDPAGDPLVDGVREPEIDG